LLNDYNNNSDYLEIRKLYEPLSGEPLQNTVPLVQLPSITRRRSVESIFSEEDLELNVETEEYIPGNIHIVDDEQHIGDIAITMLDSVNDEFDIERELFFVWQKLNNLTLISP
jgi:hypothetical protein